jgi:ADP-ribose pyrophosphatase YjhB (NUDIX family)
MNVKRYLECPKCGEMVETYQNPKPVVDIIIEMDGGGIILIHRKYGPQVWAIPGGFVDYGESVENAAVREAKEETSLNVRNLKQFHVYSNPERDLRLHTISTVFIASADGTPKADDDADDIGVFTSENLPAILGFDHAQILDDYFSRKYPR